MPLEISVLRRRCYLRKQSSKPSLSKSPTATPLAKRSGKSLNRRDQAYPRSLAPLASTEPRLRAVWRAGHGQHCSDERGVGLTRAAPLKRH